ncbi:unnamed protein product [Sphagnum troendelagicum]|uniref:BZIP domain-containing protein n=1 Tax=Sphagnum troendelagicum TaxID=128251 RepID=A0ABP0V1M0_9BRYO
MGTNPSNPSTGSNNGGLASSTLPGGGLGRYNSLARQSSIYSLTLDEFQNTMTEPGKNFGSMNMDEFLKNIWTAEESQAMAAAMGSITDSAQAGNAGGMLTRQPSLGAMSLPRTLSRKTVDQVWRDIHRDSSGGSDSGGGGLAGAAAGTMPQEREATFGEMTLEDFLVKAGVVREDAEIGSQGFSPFVGASVMTSGDIDRSVQGGSAAGDRGGATGGRKRGPDGPVEKVVERRQRRMIKNRESAARSRARKQAYQVELEAEVNQLKEENLKLRKQQLMEMMKMTGKTIASEVKALRRTRTATW